MIRAIIEKDLEKIKEFHARNSSHELDFKKTLFHGVYEKDGEIIAYGAVKEFHEMVISVNKSSSRNKSEAIKELFKVCLHLATLRGETNLYAFADNAFAEILKEHYGFQEIDRKILGIKVGG